MDAAKRIARNTGILYIRMGITVLISLYATRLILVELGAQDFGLFNLVGGVISMLSFLSASMSEATQRFISVAQGAGNTQELNRIFNASILLHIFIGICLFILMQVAGYYFLNRVLNIAPERRQAAQWIFQFMIASTLITVLGVPYDAVINARENMLIFAVLGILESVAKLLIAIFLAHTHQDKLVVYGLMITCMSVFLLVLRILYCTSHYPETKLSLFSRRDQHLLKQLSRFAGWSFLGYSSGMVANYGQGIIVNIFFGTLVNASQGIANQISGQLGTLAHTLMRALNPTIAKSEGAGDRALMIRAVMLGSKFSFFLLALVYVCVFIEMPYILALWLKEVPAFTIIFCQLLLIRNLIEQLFITLVTAISAVGNIRSFQLYASVLAFFPLIISYLFFYWGYAPYTLYIVFVFYSIICSANILYFARKLFSLPVIVFLKKVVLPCVASFTIALITSCIPHVLMQQGLKRFIVVGGISLISLLISIWFIAFSQQEKNHTKILIIKGRQFLFNQLFRYKAA